jgi:ornithine cyclodeaminase/alanine dehydrogenase-like protein (mu-crystallin family)
VCRGRRLRDLGPSPLFDSSLLRDDTVVVAVGSHEPDARELDAALLGRATVVVGDVATAPHEAGTSRWRSPRAG